MQRVCTALFVLCSLVSCGDGGIERTAAESTTKAAVKFLGRELDFEAPPLSAFTDWSYFAANVGGFLIILSVVCFVWLSNKQIGVRLMANGIVFVFTAKAIEWFGNYCVWFLLLGLIVYVVLNPVRTEKLLLKLGIKIDLNQDGKHGSDRYEVDPFDGETEKIENPEPQKSDGIKPMGDRMHG